jgi:sulfite exporter TauE/SafE
MLASITPLGERGRGQRWWLTVTAHVVGSTLGGAAIGAVMGLIGLLLERSIGMAGLTILVAVVALLGVLGDAVWNRPLLPSPHRQVNEDWLDSFRGWFYGAGFGFQLGLGVTTIITSGAVHVMLAAAALTASPVLGAVVGGVFGLARGLTVLTMAGVQMPTTLMDRHRHMQELYPTARKAAVAAQAGVLVAVVAGA